MGALGWKYFRHGQPLNAVAQLSHWTMKVHLFNSRAPTSNLTPPRPADEWLVDLGLPYFSQS